MVFISPFHQAPLWAIGSASIHPAPRYDVPDASAGILDIAARSRNQVDVRLVSCQLHRHLTPTPSPRTSPTCPEWH
jgi:hypothetical protein